MARLVIILTVLTIISAQSSEFVKVKNRILPEYRFHLRNNYSPNNVDDDVNTWTKKYDKTESSEEMDAMNSRRLFDWFSKFFKTTTPKAIQSTTTQSSYTKELKERIFFQELHRNLTDALKKITEIQKRVSDVIDRKEAYAFLTNKHIMRLDNYYRRRFKREEKGEAETVGNTTVAAKSNNTNFTDVNATICPYANDTSGRRFASDINPTEIKNKLLMYLEESFQDIENKITSLKNVKEAFMNNDSFKIGYIMANIDTLNVNMLNLKKNVDDNKIFWEDKKILELYDTLKTSNQAVSGLIQSLKMYIERLSSQS